MAMPVQSEKLWTVADLHALPDDPAQRYEIVDGVLLVSPVPRRGHQRCVLLLLEALGQWVEHWGGGLVLPAQAEALADNFTAMQPDISVVALPHEGLAQHWQPEDRLLLAVEVLSPSTARYDRVIKRSAYLRMGATYWIVDMDARLVERWVPGAAGPDILDTTIEWNPPGADGELRINLVELFARVLKPFVD